MDELEFKRRTKRAALEVIHFVEGMKRGLVADVFGRQLLRSGTSVGSNYRAACRAKSRADMKAKLGIVEEEADETVYWLELLSEAGISDEKTCAPLKQEFNEILAMTVASIRTLRNHGDEK